MSEIEILEKQQERLHLLHILLVEKRMQRAYFKAVAKIFRNQKIPKLLHNNKTFKISSLPSLRLAIDRSIKDLNAELLAITNAGISNSWRLANSKIRLFVLNSLPENIVNKRIKLLLSNQNNKALEAFKTRTTAGLKLSDRVWKHTAQFRANIENSIADGISRGESADKIARNLKQYLVQPDKTFRKVRNAKGELVGSKNMQNYHPGQGVYKSSLKNAQRLARNEVNMAHRTADLEKYRGIPFIIGYQVKLAWNHPAFDICDKLVGKYPKSFRFRGWHVACLCYSIPLFATAKEIDRYARTGEENFTYIKTVPSQVHQYIRNTVQTLPRKPFWVVENRL